LRASALVGPEKPAALGVVMRERPAFRSTFAKHALDGGRGISRARPRHKALLGKRPFGTPERQEERALDVVYQRIRAELSGAEIRNLGSSQNLPERVR